ncbi:hypothetical protein BC831DRAFT_481603 [Entophlyctis helioformis]|nr:hypothetical protein BC831DRAFT_481603 [Entophlyctis helioformis]
MPSCCVQLAYQPLLVPVRVECMACSFDCISFAGSTASISMHFVFSVITDKWWGKDIVVVVFVDFALSAIDCRCITSIDTGENRFDILSESMISVAPSAHLPNRSRIRRQETTPICRIMPTVNEKPLGLGPQGVVGRRGTECDVARVRDRAG